MHFVSKDRPFAVVNVLQVEGEYYPFSVCSYVISKVSIGGVKFPRF